MAVLRRLFVLAVCMAGAAVLAAPGLSARNVAGDEFQLGTPHFVVHYQSDSSAEWMAYRVDNYLVDQGGYELGPDELSLDCRDPFGTSQCDLSDPYLDGGYSRWPFFVYLTENYGAAFVNTIFAKGAGGAPSATDALSQAVIAKGTTLADTYDAWSTVQLTSGYSTTALQGLKPMPTGEPVQTGATAGLVKTVTVTVNHLATRYVEFLRGDGDGSKPCFAATLQLSVALPAGTKSKPVFWWDKKGTPVVALSVNGNTATASIPWDTCTWSGNEGFLSLPNASNSAGGGAAIDGADFVVTTSLSIDTTTPATPGAPPLPVSTWGPVISAPTADTPPAITVYGPELMRLSATATQARLT